MKTITKCPTCGSRVKVDGDDREGTHYYVPVVPEIDWDKIWDVVRRSSAKKSIKEIAMKETNRQLKEFYK
jgi:hypothetical protein